MKFCLIQLNQWWMYGIILLVIVMEKIVKAFDSFEEMNEENIEKAHELSPEERWHILTSLKKQYMDFNGSKEADFQSNLRASRLRKEKVPWASNETT